MRGHQLAAIRHICLEAVVRRRIMTSRNDDTRRRSQMTDGETKFGCRAEPFEQMRFEPVSSTNGSGQFTEFVRRQSCITSNDNTLRWCVLVDTLGILT